MKWSKEQENQLRELSFAEKSNKEISEIMGIALVEVYEGRSKFGITIAKVKAAKTKSETIRTKEEIENELKKVKKARDEAYKKIKRCNERIDVLEKELFDEILIEIARS